MEQEKERERVRAGVMEWSMKHSDVPPFPCFKGVHLLSPPNLLPLIITFGSLSFPSLLCDLVHV